MTIWVTADQHFGHTKVIEYCKRPFKSIDEMDEALINNWNERVKIGDVVYHLGDFTLSNYTGFKYYLDKLNGTVFFVPGGHDRRWLNEYKKHGSTEKYTVIDPLSYINIRGVELVLCHYPLLTWERAYYGTIHLHGHSHGNNGCIGVSGDGNGLKPGYRMDVGVDCNNFYPISITDILNRLDAFEGIVRV